MKKNAVEMAKEVKVMQRYGLKVNEMNDIFQEYNGDFFELISCAFKFGYAQGSKATKSMIRKEKVA